MESVCVLLGCSQKLADAYLVWESAGGEDMVSIQD